MPIQFTCLQCGRSGHAPPSRRRRFCSTACSQAYSARPRRDAVERHAAMTSPTPTRQGCLEWLGCRDEPGYGRFTVGSRADGSRKSYRAHNFSLEQKLGRPLLPGMDSLHTCDNPPCQNQDHLFEGTQAMNATDRHLKGRDGDHRGERHGRAKLTNQAVVIIRSEYPEKTPAMLAQEHRVSPSTIRRVVSRSGWSHVP